MVDLVVDGFKVVITSSHLFKYQIIPDEIK